MSRHSPVIIFGILALVVTGSLAWIVKAIVDIGRALTLPKEKP